MASLMLGLDFYESEMYVGLWSEEERSARTFVVPGKADGDHIPLFVIPTGEGRFLAGHDGIEYSIKEHINGVSLLYGRNVREKVVVNDEEFGIIELLAGFIGDVLAAVRKHFGGASVARLCITGERMNNENRIRISSALGKLGYSGEQFFVIDHANAFLRYMISGDSIRKRSHAVAIDPDCSGAGIYSYIPADVLPGTPAWTDVTDASFIINRDPESLSDNEKERVFDELVSLGLQKNKPVRYLYLTGRSIEDEKIKSVLRKYAPGSMKVFSGKNLYSSGACLFAAIGTANEAVIYDGQIFHTVSVEAYRDSVTDAVPLLSAGTPLEGAEAVIEVIPDESDRLVFHISDARRQTTETVHFPIDEICDRENKTHRLEVTVRFYDIATLVIKVRDLGFGDLYPASYRVWEQTIMLDR